MAEDIINEQEFTVTDTNTLPHWLEYPYGDLDRNWIVDEKDLMTFINYWLATSDTTDINDIDQNGDGIINSYGYSLFASNWKEIFTQPYGWQVPVGSPSEHPIIKDNKVYVPADGLYILDLADGTVLRHYLAGNWYSCAPIIDNSNFIHAYSVENGKIQKIDEDTGPVNSINTGRIDFESLTYDNTNNRLIVAANPMGPTGNYYITVSGTGQYQAAIGEFVYTSDNYGTTWTQHLLDKYVSGISISDDGQYISVSDYDFGSVWISSDGGVNWTEKLNDICLSGIALSGTGQYQTALEIGGNIYISSDYGETWTSKNTARNWKAISMSSSGQYQTAAVNGGFIYTSDDYGTTWTQRDFIRNWVDVDTGATGQYQAAVVSGGFVYLSNDYGATWTAKGNNRIWSGVAISEDGVYITAVYNGKIATSSDSGETWIPRADVQGYGCISMSDSGQYQFACAPSVYLRRSSTYGLSWMCRGILGINCDDYTIAWSNGDVAIQSSQCSPPIIVGNYVYARSNISGILYKCNLSNGSIADSVALAGTGDGYPPLIYDSDHNYIYAFDRYENNVYAVDANTLDIIWTKNLGAEYIIFGTSCYHNGRLYVPNIQYPAPFNGKLYALDVENSGEILWTNTDFGSDHSIGNGAIDDQYWYGSSSHASDTGLDAELFVINLSNGTLFKSYPLPSPTACSALTVSGGNFIIGLWDAEATLMLPIRQGGTYKDSLFKVDAYRTGYLGDRTGGFFWP